MAQIIIPEELKNFTLRNFSFFNDMVSLQLPEFMKPMTKEEYAKRFIGGTAPEAALSFSKGDAIFTISKQQLEKTTDKIDSFIGEESAVFLRIVPGYVEFGKGTKTINGVMVGCIQYKSNAIDKDLYNIFFAFINGEEVIYGLFVAPYDMNGIWTNIFLTCIDTLEIKNM